MKIDPAFFIWFVVACMALLLLLSNLRQPKQHVQLVQVAREVKEEAVVGDPDHEHAETVHWVAQGLHKLGYSTLEARRMAATVPAGMDLQQALQFCLRSKGGKK